MAQLSFSVALCTYNGSRLPEQLQSILAVAPPDELIICDDASTTRLESPKVRLMRHFRCGEVNPTTRSTKNLSWRFQDVAAMLSP
jgi:glycosyltransferase involved in cell wall biosynthesis